MPEVSFGERNVTQQKQCFPFSLHTSYHDTAKCTVRVSRGNALVLEAVLQEKTTTSCELVAAVWRLRTTSASVWVCGEDAGFSTFCLQEVPVCD